MDQKKVTNVMVAIPNMGYTPVESYGNRMINFMHLGMLQQNSQNKEKMRGLVPDEKLDELFGKENEIFNFYFVHMGRIFTPAAREEAAKTAVEYKCDYLFFIDDDMICPDDLFLKLYKHMDKADIVAPLAFTRNQPYNPVIYASREGWDEVNRCEYFMNIPVINYPKNKLVECDAVGFGAALINVELFNRIKRPWFMSSEATGEDILFCYKAKKVKGRVFMDTSVCIGHVSHPTIITEEFVENYRKKDHIYPQRHSEYKKYDALTILGD